MTEFDKIAHLIRFGLAFNKMLRKQIIDWADSQLQQDINKDFFADLSLSNTSNKIIECFSKKVQWDYNSLEIRELILSYYNLYLKTNLTSWRIIEKELIDYFSYLDSDNGNDRIEDFLYFLEDDYQVRELDNSGTLKMPDYLLDNLKVYNKYKELQDLIIKTGLKGYLI